MGEDVGDTHSLEKAHNKIVYFSLNVYGLKGGGIK